MEYTGEQVFLAGLVDGLNKTASAEAAPEGSVLAKLDANLSKVAEALEMDGEEGAEDNRSILQKLAGARSEMGGGAAAPGGTKMQNFTKEPKDGFFGRVRGAMDRAGKGARGIAGKKSVQLGAAGAAGLGAGAGITSLIHKLRAKKKGK